ncbi:hypothetical protein GA707_08495 [Nostocoides sp. F2B08]|uniref:hypothetical protein n=1 Tax=Nostocoides sp. F2B08 TaxID=2653936 RepID=UPI001263136A|nr:hypothetical protein [Tetrasphaera sp. F2B08]KAB7744630.1 hypothetical protein GA707_08495 [Tetrasphaera sp. F2B08]
MSDQETRIDPSTDTQAGIAEPLTGDIVIDSALRDLDSAEPHDLDAQIELAESLQRTLQGRLADLGD